MSAQSDLLSYLGQQLIAHGATLFAVLTAAFTFMSRMRPKDENLWRSAFYIGISGVLIGVGLYTVCRMLFYGALVDSLVRTPAEPLQALREYFNIVVRNAKEDLRSKGQPAQFIALFSSSFNYGPTIGACLFAGFAIALVIYSIQPIPGATGDRDVYKLMFWVCVLLLLISGIFALVGVWWSGS